MIYSDQTPGSRNQFAENEDKNMWTELRVSKQPKPGCEKLTRQMPWLLQEIGFKEKKLMKGEPGD